MERRWFGCSIQSELLKPRIHFVAGEMQPRLLIVIPVG